MTKNEIFILIGILILGFIIYRLITESKNQKKRLREKLKNEYGQTISETLSEETFQKIRLYFEERKAEKDFYIDDITWNDLNLDLFFQRMNRTYSSPGEEVLYDLLRTPVSSTEILKERNDLITYLDQQEGLRIRLQEIFVHTGKTKRYSMLWYLKRLQEVMAEKKWKRLYHLLLTLVAIGLLFVKPWVGILCFIVVMVFNFITYFREKSKIEPYYISIFAMGYLLESAEQLLKIKDEKLAGLFTEISKDYETLKPLIQKTHLLGTGAQFSVAGNLLDIIVDYVRMMTHLDLYAFDRALELLKNQERTLRDLFQHMGYLETMIAVGSFRKTLPYYTIPECIAGDSILAEDVYHPLTHQLIPNTLDENKSVLLTGSNASGKSTFLRMIGISEIFAYTIYTVPAKTFRADFYHVYSSMALRDNVVGGESYFVVEIKSLKRILDAVDRGEPVLCMVDEVLRGTNTAERIATSSAVLKDLAMRKIKVFAATHDLELTKILEDIYANYHFEEEISEGQVLFNYQLKKGPSKTRNAIALLRMMGYPVSVVEEAEDASKKLLSGKE